MDTFCHDLVQMGFARKNIKYRVVKIWPSHSNGSSTGRPPIHVRRAALDAIDQNRSWLGGKNAVPFMVGRLMRGRANRMRIAANIATTPPSLFGIDRRIA